MSRIGWTHEATDVDDTVVTSRNKVWNKIFEMAEKQPLLSEPMTLIAMPNGEDFIVSNHPQKYVDEEKNREILKESSEKEQFLNSSDEHHDCDSSDMEIYLDEAMEKTIRK